MRARFAPQVPVRRWTAARRVAASVLIGWLAIVLVPIALALLEGCGRGGAPAPCMPRAIATGGGAGGSAPRCEAPR